MPKYDVVEIVLETAERLGLHTARLTLEGGTTNPLVVPVFMHDDSEAMQTFTRALHSEIPSAIRPPAWAPEARFALAINGELRTDHFRNNEFLKELLANELRYANTLFERLACEHEGGLQKLPPLITALEHQKLRDNFSRETVEALRTGW